MGKLAINLLEQNIVHKTKQDKLQPRENPFILHRLL